MTQYRERKVVVLDSASVVRHADARDPTGAYFHRYIFRSRVDRIFEKLLYDGGGTVHDLPGGDKVRYIKAEYVYLSHRVPPLIS